MFRIKLPNDEKIEFILNNGINWKYNLKPSYINYGNRIRIGCILFTINYWRY